MLMIAAVAPSCARNGPVTLRAPSYVRSANRFTTPIRMTNRKTVGFGGLVIQITRCNAKIRPSGGYTSSYDGGTMRDPVVSEFPPGVWEDSHPSHAEASPAGGCRHRRAFLVHPAPQSVITRAQPAPNVGIFRRLRAVFGLPWRTSCCWPRFP